MTIDKPPTSPLWSTELPAIHAPMALDEATLRFEHSLIFAGTGGDPCLVGALGSGDGSFVIESIAAPSVVVVGRTVSAREMAKRIGANASAVSSATALFVDVMTGKRFSPDDR